MIEINLLPGGGKKRGKKGGGGGGLKLSLPNIGGLATDGYIIAAVVSVLGVFGTLGWWYMGLSARQEEVQVALADAVQDSANYADLIDRNATLAARRDSIAQKVDIIQEIDAGRYVWPHLLDELARALPDYTWLTQVIQVSVGDVLQFQVRGRSGSNLALTTFMGQLQDSPFISSVVLVQTEQVLESTGQVVYSFQLDCEYVSPPMDMIETIPLFAIDPQPVNQ
jgi:Tfp pilus assembly protein PilN